MSALPLYRDSLPNGLIILTYEDRKLPTAYVALDCRSGSSSDPEGKDGVAALTAELLVRGSSTMSGDSVTSIIEFLGAGLDAWATGDNSVLRLQLLSKDLDTGLRLLSDAVLSPAFEPKELELARTRFLTDARRIKDNPHALVSREFSKLLFGTHPYGRAAAGDTLTLPTIKREDLVRYHSECYRPNNCFIVAVGDLNRADLVRAVTARLGNWQPATVTRPNPAAPAFPERIRARIITRADMNQTYVEFGHPGITVHDSDRLSARLMSYILGGSAMSSRLGLTVREEGGLAYDVRCWFDRNLLTGAFHATVQTAKPQEAIDMMMREIRLMHESGATRTELEKAHNYYTGSFPLTYSSSEGKLSQVITQELNGYGLDWLETFPDKVKAVTLEQVNDAARVRLNPGHYAMVILGPVTKDDIKLDNVEWVE